jgi:hypothetical protein
MREEGRGKREEGRGYLPLLADGVTIQQAFVFNADHIRMERLIPRRPA